MAVENSEATGHSADASALGFYFQAFYALITLVGADSDNAAVGVEQLDDVQLTAGGETLLFQLKHTLAASPAPLTIRSRSIWRTLKVWCDLIPRLKLSETTLHLVTVAEIAEDSDLQVLRDPDSDREQLCSELVSEAERVMEARKAAQKEGKQLPFADRVDGCQAFLDLEPVPRLNLLRRVRIKDGSKNIAEIESAIAEKLVILPAAQRKPVAQRLVQWWDREVVYSMCGKRSRVISREELQLELSAAVGDIERERLIAEFETIVPPREYQPDGMLTRQIELVKGGDTDMSRAIREEWRAREQRSKWLNERLGMARAIDEYDLVLAEYWGDKHEQLREDCTELQDNEKCNRGLQLLRWTHNEAPQQVRPFMPGWSAAYYVRGSYQILAINLKVGWHPEYKTMLEPSS